MTVWPWVAWGAWLLALGTRLQTWVSPAIVPSAVWREAAWASCHPWGWDSALLAARRVSVTAIAGLSLPILLAGAGVGCLRWVAGGGRRRPAAMALVLGAGWGVAGAGVQALGACGLLFKPLFTAGALAAAVMAARSARNFRTLR